MNLVDDNDGERFPQIHVDPFKKDKIVGISIYLSKNWIEKEFYWWGKVEFRDGNTSGAQDFKDYKPTDFAILVQDMQNFINSL